MQNLNSPEELGAVMLVVPGEEWRLDNRKELIGVQFSGDRVHHLAEQNAHLGPVWHRSHLQHNVSAEPG